MEKILITGGTGLVGQHLAGLLLENQFQVSFLSRASYKDSIQKINTYHWDISKGIIEEEALQEADYIIHLAGAGVADKPWTEARKKQILESRTESTLLLHRYLQKIAQKPKAFISASAIGIYGLDTGEMLLDENSPKGKDFLAEVTHAWEESVELISGLGIRTLKLRIGVVLSKEGGALPKLIQPIRFGLGAALGSGNQYISWIHIRDLIGIFLFALQNSDLQGVYNAVASNPVSNAAFVQTAAKFLHRPLILPNVPSFAMKMFLGEMAGIVLGGNKVSNQRIKESGYHFKFNRLEEALKDLLP